MMSLPEELEYKIMSFLPAETAFPLVCKTWNAEVLLTQKTAVDVISNWYNSMKTTLDRVETRWDVVRNFVVGHYGVNLNFEVLPEFVSMYSELGIESLYVHWYEPGYTRTLMDMVNWLYNIPVEGGELHDCLLEAYDLVV